MRFFRNFLTLFNILNMFLGYLYFRKKYYRLETCAENNELLHFRKASNKKTTHECGHLLLFFYQNILQYYHRLWVLPQLYSSKFNLKKGSFSRLKQKFYSLNYFHSDSWWSAIWHVDIIKIVNTCHLYL